MSLLLTSTVSPRYLSSTRHSNGHKAVPRQRHPKGVRQGDSSDQQLPSVDSRIDRSTQERTFAKRLGGQAEEGLDPRSRHWSCSYPFSLLALIPTTPQSSAPPRTYLEEQRAVAQFMYKQQQADLELQRPELDRMKKEGMEAQMKVSLLLQEFAC